MVIEKKIKITRKAEKYITKGKLKEAIKEYQTIIRDDPSDIKIRLKIAELYYKSGDLPEAIRIFEEISEYYISHGFLLKAAAVLKQILKIKAHDEIILQKLASLYQQLGLNSNAINIYHDLIDIYDRSGRKIEKLTMIKKLLDLDPENIRSRLRLAEEMSKESMLNEAVEQFRIILGHLKKREAVEDYIIVAERLLYHQPDDLEISRELASFFVEKNEGLKALSYLQTCFQAAPQDPEVFELLARAFEILGQPYKASIIWKELAHYFERTALSEEKIEAYERVVLLNPEDQEARKILGLDTTDEFIEFEFEETDDVSSSEEYISEEISVSDSREHKKTPPEKVKRINNVNKFDVLPVNVRKEVKELEFYIRENLHEEARSKLDEIIKKYPQHPFLLGYLDKVE